MIQLIHAKQSQSPDCSFYTPLMMGPHVEAPVFHAVFNKAVQELLVYIYIYTTWYKYVTIEWYVQNLSMDANGKTLNKSLKSSRWYDSQTSKALTPASELVVADPANLWMFYG
jgi:hypothetical protein